MNFIPKDLFFIDTNIIAHWCIGEKGIMDYLKKRYRLSNDLVQAYKYRYRKSMELIQYIISDKVNRNNNEFYISTFILNELLSAIRDELISVILFNKGLPISRWPYARREQTINEAIYQEIYKLFLDSIDVLFEDEKVILLNEASPIGEKNYFEIFSSILFVVKSINLQDAMLVTTAIFQNADYFITDDQPLRRAAKKIINKQYGMDIINQTEALIQFRR